MQGLHYRAIDERGRVHFGFSSIENPAELSWQLQQRGWQPLPVSGLQRVANAVGFGPRASRWTRSDSAIFTQQLSQLLDAGVPLLEALEELINMEDTRSTRSALSELKSRVDQGDSLSDAMSAYPGLFGPEDIATVRAGEASGELSRCLRQQAVNLQWQSELSEKLKIVLAYPVFALVSLVAVFLFLLLYLVPAMLPLLAMSHTPLPVHTKWLIELSELIRQSGVVVLFALCIVGILFFTLMRSRSALRWRIQTLLLNGVYGRITTHYSLARYARSTSLLYESGVEITDAMRISQKLVANALLRKQLSTACQKVLSGESIANAMQSQPGLPRMFVQMISAGERAGVIDVALRQCADQLQSTAQYSLDRVERLVGPVLLCVMGSLLLWVILSVMGPIYASVGTTGMSL